MLEKFNLRFVMTALPYHVKASDSLASLKQELSKHNVRHLPVLEGSDIVGIVSDRDVALASSLAQHAVEEEALTAGDICTPDPYTVDIEEPFDRVLSFMGKERLGSALVTENGELAGIITTTDICLVCGEIFKQLLQQDMQRAG